MSLRETLTGIVDSLNRTRETRTVVKRVESSDGYTIIHLPSLLPADSRSYSVASVETDRGDVVPHWRQAGDSVEVELHSRGVHFRPQPWDALSKPVELTLVVGFKTAAMSVSEDLGGEEGSGSLLAYFGIDLEAGTEHVVTHGKGSRRFVERIVDTGGRAQFASVEALDGDRVRVRLTDAIPVRLDLIFMPDGDAAAE